MRSKEIESVILLQPFERYKYFMKRVADSEIIFSLKRKNDWAIAEVEGNPVFSVWSHKEYAKLNTVGIWEDCNVIEISLKSFRKELVPIIQSNGYFLNVFSIKGKTGFVVELDEFLRDLDEALTVYE